MDNNENIEKDQNQEAQQAPAEEKENAKNFWKETPFDEMQHVKPDSFAGLSSDSPESKDGNDKKGQANKDPDAYWRPRGNSDPNRGGSGQKPNQGPAPNGNGPFRSRKNRIGLIIFAALIILFALTLFSGNNNANTVSYSAFKEAVVSGNVTSANIKNSTNIIFTLKNGAEYKTRIPYSDGNLLELLESNNVVIEGSDADISILALVLEFLPWLIFIGFTIMLLRQTTGSGQMMQFGKSHAKQYTDKDIKTTFKDVAGQKEAKYELQEVVEFLKDPKKYSEIGAKIPKGVLLCSISL